MISMFSLPTSALISHWLEFSMLWCVFKFVAVIHFCCLNQKQKVAVLKGHGNWEEEVIFAKERANMLLLLLLLFSPGILTDALTGNATLDDKWNGVGQLRVSCLGVVEQTFCDIDSSSQARFASSSH